MEIYKKCRKITEPTNEGTEGQVLTTDGNGNRSWSSIEGFAVIDNLTTDDSSSGLSARQGKVLNEKIEESKNDISNCENKISEYDVEISNLKNNTFLSYKGHLGSEKDFPKVGGQPSGTLDNDNGIIVNLDSENNSITPVQSYKTPQNQYYISMGLFKNDSRQMLETDYPDAIQVFNAYGKIGFYYEYDANKPVYFSCDGTNTSSYTILFGKRVNGVWSEETLNNTAKDRMELTGAEAFYISSSSSALYGSSQFNNAEVSNNIKLSSNIENIYYKSIDGLSLMNNSIYHPHKSSKLDNLDYYYNDGMVIFTSYNKETGQMKYKTNDGEPIVVENDIYSVGANKEIYRGNEVSGRWEKLSSNDQLEEKLINKIIHVGLNITSSVSVAKETYKNIPFVITSGSEKAPFTIENGVITITNDVKFLMIKTNTGYEASGTIYIKIVKNGSDYQNSYDREALCFESCNIVDVEVGDTIQIQTYHGAGSTLIKGQFTYCDVLCFM